MVRSLNKVMLIGNLTRDPELRYTPQGTAVCSFGLATNRGWTTESGEKKEDAEFHNIVAWNKLAELCTQFLKKGRKAYVEGRLATRSWTAQDGSQRIRVEVVADNMLFLDSRRTTEEELDSSTTSIPEASTVQKEAQEEPEESSKVSAKSEAKKKKTDEEDVNPDDIPF